MTDLTEFNMAEPIDDDASGGRRIMWMMISGLGIVVTGGAIAGFLAEQQAQAGRSLGTTGIIAISVFGAIIVGLVYAIWHNGRLLSRDSGDLTRRERLNRNIIIGCMALGAVMGGMLAVTGNLDVTDRASGAPALFDDSPIPTIAALCIAFFWAVAMPVIAWFWHTRAIDEQEASAYRDGGYYSAYAYLILAPTWWLLWRGGLLPKPNGVAIFLAFTSIWTVVWFWKKYR